MTVKDIGCLLTNSSRSKAYIQKMISHNLRPEQAFVVSITKHKAPKKPWGQDAVAQGIERAFQSRRYFLYSNTPNAIHPIGQANPQQYHSFDPAESVTETLEKHDIPYTMLEVASINDPSLIETIDASNLKYVIFSGGGILRKNILSLKQRFIHIHPGMVPCVRGSMALEWSILLRGRCAASAFFMTADIDTGELIATREFDIPTVEHGNIAPYYSSHIRSELLVDILQAYKRDGVFHTVLQDAQGAATYYKMHPVLGNIVFDKCRCAHG